MNWYSRDLSNIIAMLQIAKDLIETIKETQEEKLDNVPENLQNGIRAQEMEARIDSFEECFDSLETIINDLEDL